MKTTKTIALVKFALFTLISTGFVSACSSPPRDTFDLTVNRFTAPTNKTHKNIQILIAKPDAVKALDGQDIVIRQGGAIAYLKKAQWSDRLPNLIQARLVQAFDNSNQFGGVGRPGDGLAINYQILTDIRSFDVEVGNNQKIANIEISIKIMDDRNGNIRASRIFRSQSGVIGVENNQYAHALDTAFSALTIDIVNWVTSAL
ncbi:ABC-type transport auxiliary lipoprotein family protein [Bartonella tamiae]|uniref:ABC-type transport auxiliary lipoprotein component domain-containing protein n=1 Tax=Bartonella tamiae Th239 TaxID=1094558 RepID=J0QZY6_9HYPH|nr:ABC-type transport auxiliary lipoprotein family protein [Bartonella tamiae]EJF88819.1 hypothetical protein ME5_01370 [Bartonella tamiae Th239]EJF94931.1 hypothetical protein MEG_00512 [Bartonella tamiae Th307]